MAALRALEAAFAWSGYSMGEEAALGRGRPAMAPLAARREPWRSKLGESLMTAGGGMLALKASLAAELPHCEGGEA